jgi:integrase
MTKRTGRAVAERVVSVAKNFCEKKEKAMKRNSGPLSPMEVQALLKAAKGNAYQEAIVMILLHSGMRLCELRSLRLSDIDLKTNTLTIRSSKTGEVRSVPFCNALHDILEKLMDFRVTPHGKGDSAFIPREAHQTLLFCDGQGEPCPRGHINFLNKLGAKAGLSRKVALHQLRHTFAVVLREHLSVYEVAKLMGYKTIHC